ncbi:hypothetical protein MJO28_003722 [Puccinia striiformis f. sp. tritici]|uniref:Cytochrome P450 n=2 Tax=Puccinia striiformis f. sp. tritici TaxID=168172 RepID=A0A0L0US01_9BASI|nr:hypothetical protein Pst134EA_007668 [Puccinia striiformis f. sp. tritici]KAI9624801.1 hypothetical protein KEM48_008693 [Puccinia striiformis f. sp. tritici PST-130]KNE89760.1 hypothetical protein PSTG_16793 [Puccinia striiformis f. sp. tritici PST-78]KAH9460594.1 hypothetical protein Pst134EB_008759 [Puccinia striiformis f. sp. tritici]KAH9470410.1 hypothetical protein Pst134EA_007668 [Puccinia striiformis f. sp. tritici]KAI7956627.1 hypothetical protein MJO28_003722 [Puccinia striiformis
MISTVHAMGSAELPFLSLHLLSHSFSGIFSTHPFDFGNLLLREHSTTNSWIQKNAVLVLRRWTEWLTGPHGFYIISFLISGLLIYDAFRPRPLNGIPTSGHYSWAIGDSGALYRHMKVTGTRTTFFTDQANRVGPLSQVMLGPAGSWFGKLTGLGSHIIVLADGQQLVEVCAKRSREFPDPGLTLDIYKGIIPNGQLALPTGHAFKHHRRAIAHSMSSSHLSQVTPKITNSVIELIQLWKKRSQILDESGETYFKAAQDLRLSTMDTISDIIFGKPFGVMSARLSHLETTNGTLSADSRPQFPTLARALNVIVREVAMCYVAPSKSLFWFYQRLFNWEWLRAKSTVFSYLKKEVEKERIALAEEQSFGGVDSKDPDNVDSVLSLLVKDEQQSKLRGEKPLSTDEITQELLVYWVAGHGTMACTLAWAVKLLSNNPEVQYRLRDELVNTLPSLNERSPTFSDLKVCSSDLSYLDATCFEILRYGKVLGEVSRTSRVDAVVMGHLIPKDTVVMMPHSRLGGSQDDDSEFRPERWIDCDGKFDAQLPGPLHVFGHGQRGCFGKNLAVLELKLYIAMLCMELFFDRVPDHVNSMDATELVANHPLTCVIRPIPWSKINNNL